MSANDELAGRMARMDVDEFRRAALCFLEAPEDGFKFELTKSPSSPAGIPWVPIADMPEALKDGRAVLFHFPPVMEGARLSCMAGYWWGNDWRLPTGSGIDGATHFAEIDPPEGV